MNKTTRNFLLFAGLGFVGYMLFKRMGAQHATAAATAARQGATVAQNFVAATAQPVDSVLTQYGMQGMSEGPVVSEQ